MAGVPTRRLRPKLSMAVALALLLFTVPRDVGAWGFEAHKFIADQVVGRLPPGLRELFETRRVMFVEHSIDPDLWRNVGFEEEPPRHFLDIDAYGVAPFDALPRDYAEAVKKFGEEKVKAEGLLPWRIAEMHDRLRRTFEQMAKGDAPGYAYDNVVFFSAVLSHYVGDAHVPFHAVANYDGQLTGQHGVHSRFESDLFSRLRPTLKLDHPAVAPVTVPRDAAFATVIDSQTHAAALLEADRQAIGTGDLYDEGYFTRFGAAGAARILDERVNRAIATVAAYVIGAWESAGRPDLSRPRPPRPPQRKRAPRADVP